jgi:glutamate-1-semialdehyde 2,1-aminomutase
LPYNDIEHAVTLINRHADELAGVIMEPVSAFGLGCVPAEREFLHAIREATARHEIPLILDEVVTNFRFGLGGASQYYGIVPDLVCLGKIVGGGFPIGGYGGRQDLMELVTPPDLKGKVYQSGTFSGNVISMVAGLAVIEELEKGDVYFYVDTLGDRMRNGLRGIAQDLGVDMAVLGIKSMFQLHFGLDDIRNYREKSKADRARATRFSRGLIVHGVYATPHPLFLSTAHTEQDVDRTLEVVETVLKLMA